MAGRRLREPRRARLPAPRLRGHLARRAAGPGRHALLRDPRRRPRAPRRRAPLLLPLRLHHRRPQSPQRPQRSGRLLHRSRARRVGRRPLVARGGDPRSRHEARRARRALHAHRARRGRAYRARRRSRRRRPRRRLRDGGGAGVDPPPPGRPDAPLRSGHRARSQRRAVGPRLPACHAGDHPGPVVLRGALQERSLHARHPDVRGVRAGDGALPALAGVLARQGRLALRAGARRALRHAVPRAGRPLVARARLRGVRPRGARRTLADRVGRPAVHGRRSQGLPRRPGRAPPRAGLADVPRRAPAAAPARARAGGRARRVPLRALRHARLGAGEAVARPRAHVRPLRRAPPRAAPPRRALPLHVARQPHRRRHGRDGAGDHRRGGLRRPSRRLVLRARIHDAARRDHGGRPPALRVARQLRGQRARLRDRPQVQEPRRDGHPPRGGPPRRGHDPHPRGAHEDRPRGRDDHPGLRGGVHRRRAEDLLDDHELRLLPRRRLREPGGAAPHRRRARRHGGGLRRVRRPHHGAGALLRGPPPPRAGAAPHARSGHGPLAAGRQARQGPRARRQDHRPRRVVLQGALLPGSGAARLARGGGHRPARAALHRGPGPRRGHRGPALRAGRAR